MAEVENPATLSVEQLSVRRGDKIVLDSVSFESSSKTILSILGPNGAGKTTLLKAIAGLLPFDGQVRLSGKPLSSFSPREKARQLAFVPQHTLLRSALPVRSVVAQGRYAHLGGLAQPRVEDREAIDLAMEKTDVAQFAERAFTDLSFGEQRRVLLARGLCTGASILCLDEPAASLDIAHALSLHALLGELAQEGHCIVVVMHDLDDALLHTNRALLLHHGHQVALGASSEVIAPSHVESVYGVRMQPDAGLRFTLCKEDKG